MIVAIGIPLETTPVSTGIAGKVVPDGIVGVRVLVAVIKVGVL